MHGVRRPLRAPSAAQKQAKAAAEKERLAAYLALEQDFFALNKSGEHSAHALETCGKLLALNPELYTAWNFRRRVLASLLAAAPHEEQRGLLLDELQLTRAALTAHPKVYWIWNHRTWCVGQLAGTEQVEVKEGEAAPAAEGDTGAWAQELRLVDEMLRRDGRNFHGWNHRRFVLAQTPTPSSSSSSSSSSAAAAFPHSLLAPEQLPPATLAAHLARATAELAYTLRHIERDFSNFSAWHQRAVVLPCYWHGKGLTEEERERERDVEFDLIKQAMYTDPEDESIWRYHAWLVELAPSAAVLEREVALIEELLELEPSSKWCMQALATYSEQLASLLSSSEGEQSAAAAAKHAERASALLQQLADVDPDRAARYREQGAAKGQ